MQPGTFVDPPGIEAPEWQVSQWFGTGAPRSLAALRRDSSVRAVVAITLTATLTTVAAVEQASATVASVRLVAADGAAGDHFGGALWYDTFVHPVKAVYIGTPHAIAMSSDGSTVAVGTPGAASSGRTGAGAVYVYHRSGSQWQQTARLQATDGAAYDGFGWSVAISGDGTTIAVGAPYANNGDAVDAGAAYTFVAQPSGFVQRDELRGADTAAYDNFGTSLALARNGSTLLVGAPSADEAGTNGAGAAYLFGINAGSGHWSQLRALVSAATISYGNFGFATALSADGSTALVTSPTYIAPKQVLRTGSAEIFTSNDAWSTMRRAAAFGAPNRNTDGTQDWFGTSASLSDDGTIAAVGAPAMNVGDVTAAGGAYLWNTTSGWQPRGTALLTLRPASAKPYLYFGTALSLDGPGATIAIGVDGAGSNGQGRVDVAHLARNVRGRLTMVRRTMIAAPENANAGFGTAVALSANATTAVASAPLLTVGGMAQRGAAYALDTSSL